GNADSVSDIDTCVAYLELCFRLDLPVVITVTKMDLAFRSGLRETLSRVLSVLKQADRKPIILSASAETTTHGSDIQSISPSDWEGVGKAIESAGQDLTLAVPIVFTS